MKGIGSWLTKHGERIGDKLALVYKDRRLTYHQLNQRVNALAHGLVQLGVRKGDRVAALLLNGNELMEGMFACAKLGAIFVPINFRLSPEEVAYILNDASSRVFLYSAPFRQTALAASRNARQQLLVHVGDAPAEDEVHYEALIDDHSTDEPDCDVGLEDVHMMMYTSGTTGRPKGTLLTHANTQWNAVNALIELSISKSDSTLSVAPLFHIGAMSILTTPLLYVGGTVVIHDQFDPRRVLETIAQEKISSLFLVPAMWLAITHLPDFEQYSLESLRLNISGGATCPITVIEFFQKRAIPFYEGFGLTETAPCVCILDAPNAARKNGSVGKPLQHVDVRIVDDKGKDVAAGAVGELLVRGPNVMAGYWNKPEATREALSGGWFHTGDLARMDEEGFLYIVDRKKDMVITGGENVYSAEVEQVLFRHPNIREAAVIGVPDEIWGESVKAFVALKDESQPLTPEELRTFCEGKLARFKIPKYVELVAALPRNTTGKVLKTVLRSSRTTVDN